MKSQVEHPQGLRRQILEDVLGDSVEEYENFNKEEAECKRQHRQRIPLWQFLLHLLNRDNNEQLIEWNRDYELEFRIKDTVGVAELWGSVKNKTDMTYEKLGRAMRYYYGKSIIEKVAGRRYSYRFILSRRTKKYLSQFLNISQMKILPTPESDHDNDDENLSDGQDSSEKKIVKKRELKKETSNLQMLKAKSQIQANIEAPISAVHHRIKQSTTKTKIFRPDDSPFTRVNPANDIFVSQRAEQKNTIIYQDDTRRRSAFVVPNKNNNNNNEQSTLIERLHSLPAMPLQGRLPPAKFPHGRKRSYPFPTERNAIAYCCCGSHNCNVKVLDYSSEDSECESSYSYGSLSPMENKTMHMLRRAKHYDHFDGPNEEFILRRDSREYREREESQIYKLKQNLDMKFDPFMGYKEAVPVIDDFLSETSNFRATP